MKYHIGKETTKENKPDGQHSSEAWIITNAIGIVKPVDDSIFPYRVEGEQICSEGEAYQAALDKVEELRHDLARRIFEAFDVEWTDTGSLYNEMSDYSKAFWLRVADALELP